MQNSVSESVQYLAGVFFCAIQRDLAAVEQFIADVRQQLPIIEKIANTATYTAGDDAAVRSLFEKTAGEIQGAISVDSADEFKARLAVLKIDAFKRMMTIVEIARDWRADWELEAELIDGIEGNDMP